MNKTNDKHCIIWGCHCDEEGDQICRTYIIPLESLHPKEKLLFIGNSWQDCHDQLYVPIKGNRLNTRQVNIFMLLDKAEKHVKQVNENTGEFIFIESSNKKFFVVGFIEFVTDEDVKTSEDGSTQIFLTEKDIGKPLFFCRMLFEIFTNDEIRDFPPSYHDPIEHPNWERILNKYG